MAAPPLFATTWPGPTGAAPPVVLQSAAVAGVAAAALLPLDRPGLGWFLLALVLTAAALVVARRAAPRAASRPASERSADDRIAAVAWSLAAIALLGVGAIHASGWLFKLCVLAAWVAGSLAVAGGRSVRGLALGAVAVPIGTLRGLGWAARGAAALRRTENGRGARIVGSVLVSVLLLAIFVPLLASADAAFARIVSDALPDVDGAALLRWILLFGLIGAGTLGAGYTLIAPPLLTSQTLTSQALTSQTMAGQGAHDDRTERRGRLRRPEWALPVGVLVALFASFVAVQVAALFGGSDYVQRTTALTYAEYARSGFWQLVLVTVLTLVVIVSTARWAATESAGDRAWLRALLGGLAVLTLVIVASALSRMWAYQQAYGFTVLRVLVTACELWLGVVYVLVLAAGVRLRSGWLPRAIVAVGLAALLGLAVLNPERFIAGQNLQRFEQSGQIDLGYLYGLSADVAPEIARLPEPWRRCGLAVQAEKLHRAGDDEWRGWNAARAAARELTAGVDRSVATSCVPSASTDR